MTGQDGTPGKGGRKAKSAAAPAAPSEKPVRKKRDPEPEVPDETRPSEPFRLRGAPMYFGSGG